MKNLKLELRVGLFTLVGLICTGYLIVVLSPEAFNSKNYTSYYTYLKNAQGLVPKSHVKTNGVSVGKVEKVELGTNNTHVTLMVHDKVRIPVGSTLVIKTVGLLGDAHIEILRAEDTGEFIPEGGLIPQSETATDLSGLIDTAGGIAKDIREVSQNIAKVLGRDGGEKRIEEIVQNLQLILQNTASIVSENRESVNRTVKNLEDLTKSIREMLNDDNRAKFSNIVASLDAAMVNIDSISKKIDVGEGTLGKLVNDDKALTEIEGAIKDIRKVLAPATRTQMVIDSHIEARNNNTTQSYLNLKLVTRSDKYYLVGVTDVGDEIVEERTKEENQKCEEEDADCTTYVRRSKSKEGSLRFNLQFAKRFGPAVVRAGLFETKGGFGLDFYLLSDAVRLSIEAFDWDADPMNEIRRVAHLKTYLRFLFFKHIYLVAGLDDPTRFKKRGVRTDTQKDNYFFGAGITFTDDDLKSLFGIASVGGAL